MPEGGRRSSLAQRLERPAVRLFLYSFVLLFTELMLIRWSAAYVVYLAYFSNFVLLASFLGIGIGFMRPNPEGSAWERRLPFLLLGMIAFIVLFPVQVHRAATRSFVGLFGLPPLPIWVSLPLIFAGVMAVMASIAQGMARIFGRFPPLSAYRIDVAGSLCGIVAFSGLAFLGARPVVWTVIVCLVVGALWFPSLPRLQVGALAVCVALALAISLAPHDHWSPYYRVTTSHDQRNGTTGVKVNGLPHQSVVPLDLLARTQPFYLYPYRHVDASRLDDVLIVGAGSGNDVAVALAHGARHVDAVEIDPVLQGIGQEFNPNHPYDDPRVTVHIDDGRAFLERTTNRYDLIVFALPDSLTLVSGQSSLRLESYLFTEQAMESARDHLRPDGAFTMYNYYRPNVFDRFAATMNRAFGQAPCIDLGSVNLGPREQAVLTVGRRPGAISCSTPWSPPAVAPAVATDDHPFPYLAGRTIPTFYLVTLSLILAGAAAAVRLFGGVSIRGMRPYVDLFFMGAAFLLLETKNVVQFALLFGTTWLVNSLVFAGILLAVLGAVEWARRWKLPRPVILYGVLAAALAVAWLVPPDSLLQLQVVPRFFAAAAIAFAPVFVANLIFAQRFKETASSTLAFGANLLGAMLGGILEYTALMVGYRALLVVVLVLYSLAFLTRGRIVPATSGAH